ncbi:MAG: glycosyltransferase family 2 protein [Deltaproteobacteria bacterium]|nr:glycosyltransferase family 2 protein [Deltaproteobacteria bacterium]
MSRLFSDKPLSEPALSSTRSINPVNALHIVIINFNSGEHLLNCLNSVAESISTLSATLDVMVTVIDNASTDNSAKEAASKFGARQRFNFHLLPTNLGFGGGINKALEADNSAAALILNPDVKISADCIFKLIEALDNCDNLGAVAPLLRDEAGKIDERYLPRRFPTLGSTIAELFYLHRLFPANPWTASYLGKDDYCFSKYFREALFPEASKVCLSKNPFLVEQPAAACLMVRAAAFKAISGFDERYWPAWFEDVDFSKRLLESNWLSAFLASARAIHAGGHSLKFITNAQFAHIWYGNMARYWRKHASRRQYSVFASVLRLAILLRSGVNLLWGLWQFATGRRGASRRALNLAKALLRRAISPFSQ